MLFIPNDLFGQTDTAQDKLPTTEKSLLDGMYFGVSKDKFGQRAWILYINTKRSSSFLYLPPELISITKLSLTSSGQLTFQTTGTSGEIIYSFSGKISSDNIKGRFLTERKGRTISEKLNEAEVELQKIDLEKGTKHPIAGLYSNMRNHEESGDVVGAMLILIPREKGIIGVFVPYDGSLTPYAIYNVQYSDKNKRLVFEIEKQGGNEPYSGVVSARSVRIKLSDPKAFPYAETLILPKRNSLTEIFSK